MPKKKSKQKYKPLSEATREDIQESMKMGSYWLTDELEGHTESGDEKYITPGEGCKMPRNVK